MHSIISNAPWLQYNSSSASIHVQSSFIFIEPDVKQFPVTYADAGVASLVALVAIVATQVFQFAFAVNLHFVDGEQAKALAVKPFSCL